MKKTKTPEWIKNLKEVKSPPSPALMRARKRNWAKFVLSSAYGHLGSILMAAAHADSIYDLPQLTDKEFLALVSIKKDIKLVLQYWSENFELLK